MVNPLLGLSAGIGAIYSVGKAIDNERYWRDYSNNTGKVARYPFHVGRANTLGYIGSAGYFGGRLKRF